MTSLQKAFWHSEKDNITLSMPIAKIDKERRIVSGFATLDNVDKQSDIVPIEVSIKAFEKFRGNLREMHMPIAVGKVMSFKSDKYYHKEEEKFYNGVYVDAYISKGAKDTWEKILDGTLSGFSIGGSIKGSDKAYSEDMDKEIRVIKDYELHELSLVDNPANQFANILSIQKAENGENTFGGMLSKTTFENVFWSKENGTIRLSKEEDIRGDEVSIGFVESNDEDKASVIKGLLKSQENKLGEELAKNENLEKEGIDMANKKIKEVVEETTVEKAAETEEVIVDEIVKSDTPEDAPAEETKEAPAEEAPVEEAPAEEAVEKSEEAPAEEAVVEKTEEAADAAATPAEQSIEAELVKSIDTVKTSVEDLSKSVIEAVSDLSVTISTLKEQIAEITKSITSVKEEVTAVKGNVEEFGKRVDAVEDDTAVRKSGDLGGIVQETKIKKSMWGGRFLNSVDLYR
jgi:regulator of replication initiation timing